MAVVRHRLDQALLDDARAELDAGRERQYAIDQPRGLRIHIRGGELNYTVQARTKAPDRRSSSDD